MGEAKDVKVVKKGRCWRAGGCKVQAIGPDDIHDDWLVGCELCRPGQAGGLPTSEEAAAEWVRIVEDSDTHKPPGDGWRRGYASGEGFRVKQTT